jgi:type I restriction enzyme S subunit
MQTQNNIPALRFPEFDGDWESNKMKKVTTYVDYRGRGPEKSESGAFLVTAKNIKKGFINYEGSKEYVPLKNYKSVMSKGLPKIGDVLFTTEAPLGNVAQVDDDKIALAQRVIKLRGNEFINNQYLLYYILSPNYQKLINRKAIGTTVLGISGKELQKSIVNYPTLPEQQKIASFLSAVDEKIQQLTRKAALLEQYKKGIMQQLFSGKLRFKDEDGKDFPEWEEKKLGEVGETYNGLTGKTKEDFGTGKPYVQYKQIFDDSKIDISRFELVNVSADEKQNRVLFGDVFFTVSSETPNEIGTASVLLDKIDELYLNSFCFGFRAYSIEILSPYFSKYLFRNSLFRNNIIKLAQGSTRYNMSKVQLMKLKVQLPSLKEQQKIASFLSGIDDKIASVNAQLEQTQTFKKGLLQQMFV